MAARIKGLWIFCNAFCIEWGSWEELRRQAQGIYYETLDMDEAEGMTEEQWEQWRERQNRVEDVAKRKAEFWAEVEADGTVPWDGAEEKGEDEKWDKWKNMLFKKDAWVRENNMVVRKNSKKKADVAKEENGERLIK